MFGVSALVTAAVIAVGALTIYTLRDYVTAVDTRDEVYYVIEGGGYALQWEVEAEIAEKYYARVALEPKRYEITQGDTLYVPQNHVCQIFAADGTPLRLFNAQNRVFKHLGYDHVHFMEPCPAYTDATGEMAGSRSWNRNTLGRPMNPSDP